MDKISFQIELNKSNSKEYTVKVISNSKIYVKKSYNIDLASFYNLVLRKSYYQDENTFMLTLTIQHLLRLDTNFHKEYPEKQTATLPLINYASLISRLIIKPSTK